MERATVRAIGLVTTVAVLAGREAGQGAELRNRRKLEQSAGNEVRSLAAFVSQFVRGLGLHRRRAPRPAQQAGVDAAVARESGRRRRSKRLLTKCAWCNRFTDGQGAWSPLPDEWHDPEQTTTTICSDCHTAMSKVPRAG
jgi:hypothetical protein